MRWIAGLACTSPFAAASLRRRTAHRSRRSSGATRLVLRWLSKGCGEVTRGKFSSTHSSLGASLPVWMDLGRSPSSCPGAARGLAFGSRPGFSPWTTRRPLDPEEERLREAKVQERGAGSATRNGWPRRLEGHGGRDGLSEREGKAFAWRWSPRRRSRKNGARRVDGFLAAFQGLHPVCLSGIGSSSRRNQVVFAVSVVNLRSRVSC